MSDYILRPEVTVGEWGEGIVALHSNGGFDAVREIMPLETFNALFAERVVADIETLEAIRRLHNASIVAVKSAKNFDEILKVNDDFMVEIEKILGGQS